jgi:hypothetical protein
MNRQVSQFHNWDMRVLSLKPYCHIHDTESLPWQFILFIRPVPVGLGSCADLIACSRDTGTFLQIFRLLCTKPFSRIKMKTHSSIARCFVSSLASNKRKSFLLRRSVTITGRR